MNKLNFLALIFTYYLSSQIVNIPDVNFKKKLLEANPSNKIAVDLSGNYFKIDANDDGEIQIYEAENVKILYINGSYQKENDISSLEGILSFKNLKILHCCCNQLTSLDLQGLIHLLDLDCYNNKLISLNVQGLNNLKHIDCGHNQLFTLNAQGLINLEVLECYSNRITSLDVLGCTNLIELICPYNNLKMLDLTSLENLKSLDFHNNDPCIHLKLEGCIKLQEIGCMYIIRNGH